MRWDSRQHPPCGASTSYMLLGDGKLLWKSGRINRRAQGEDCQLDVTGVNVLELRSHYTGYGGGARTVWINPHLLRKP